MRLQLQGMLHDLLVMSPVRLCAQRMNRRPLAEVQHPILDAGPVRGLSHLAAQRVQFPDQMALPGSADGGVARHVPHAVQVHREADRLHPESGRGQRSLDPGMSRSDHGDITCSRCKSDHKRFLLFSYTDKELYKILPEMSSIK